MKIQPIGDKIVIEVLLDNQETEGGLALSDEARKRNNKGKVLAVGEGIQLPDGTIKELSVHTDDIVLYTAGAGIEVMSEGKELRIVSIRDIMGIITD